MANVIFRTKLLPSRPGSWHWELYVDGEELPVAGGFERGTEADLQASIERAQQFVLDILKNPQSLFDLPQSPEFQLPKTPVEAGGNPPECRINIQGLKAVKLRLGATDIG